MQLAVLIVLLVYYVAMFCWLIAASYSAKYQHLRVPFKTLTSLAFIALAVYCAAVAGSWTLFLWMLPGFLACLVGDVLLAMVDNTWRDGLFTAGVVAFAIAHIAFLVAISQMFAFRWVELILPVLALGMAYGLSRLPKMNLGKLKYSTIVYAFLIAWLLSKTLVWLVVAGPSAVTLLFFFGALLFFSSDLMLLFIYFYESTPKLLRFFNQITYYGGVALMAAALAFV